MLLYVYLDHTKAKFKSYLGSIIEEISVELSIYKTSVTPRVAIFQGYMNSHLVHETYCKIGRDETYCKIGCDETYCKIGRDETYCKMGRDETYCKIGRDETYCKIGRDEIYCIAFVKK